MLSAANDTKAVFMVLPKRFFDTPTLTS